jgi:hypothetical protein
MLDFNVLALESNGNFHKFNIAFDAAKGGGMRRVESLLPFV